MGAMILLGGVAVATAAPQIFEPVLPDEPLQLCEEHGYWLRLADRASDWEEISRLPGIKVFLPYATYKNVSGHDLYCGVHRAFLHKDAAVKLKAAVEELRAVCPRCTLQVMDAGRPRHAQELLYETVRNTPFKRYVSDPLKGSVHSYGMAVDVTILDSTGTPLDMGTSYDAFERTPQPVGEKQLANRLLLRDVMHNAGFKWLDKEWWHFNAEKSAIVRRNYTQLEDRNKEQLGSKDVGKQTDEGEEAGED